MKDSSWKRQQYFGSSLPYLLLQYIGTPYFIYLIFSKNILVYRCPKAASWLATLLAIYSGVNVDIEYICIPQFKLSTTESEAAAIIAKSFIACYSTSSNV